MSELQDLLLQQMINGHRPDAAEMNRMFAEHEDPRVRLIAQFMNQEAAVTRDAQHEEAPTPQLIEVAPARAADTASRRKLRRVLAELHEAQAIGDTLAAALGACYLCWGEDPHCEHCGGAGHSGWCEPDAEQFAAFVAPALERLRETSREFDSTGPAKRSHFADPHASDGPTNRS
jgi:hypothetical protein